MGSEMCIRDSTYTDTLIRQQIRHAFELAAWQQSSTASSSLTPRHREPRATGCGQDMFGTDRECPETAKSCFVNIAVIPFRYDRKYHLTRYTTALVHQDSFKPGSSLDTTRRFLGWDIHATDQKQKQRKRACILVLLTNVTNKKQVKTKAE